MHIPGHALSALRTLERGGYKAYIVGGCVRDSLLGIQPKDYDITTSARPEQVLALFAGYKTVTAGLKHGTIGVVIDGVLTEITTFRSDGIYTDHRRPETVNFMERIEDDLSRRDFTVNAMAYSPSAGIIDPFGGERDLNCGVLRAVGDPDIRFSEDALRILRGIRFASVYGLEPEPATARAILAGAPLLSAVSAERICSEFFRTLPGRYAGKYMYKFRGAYYPVLPELGAMAARPDALYGDRLKKSLAVTAKLDGEICLRLAALLEDVDPAGRDASAEAACAILIRLKTDRATRDNTARLIREPDLTAFSRAELRRLIARLTPERTIEFLRLRKASAETAGGGDEAGAYGGALELADTILRSGECVSRGTLELSGDDLASLGMRQGKMMGELLDTLLGEVLDGRLENTKPALATRASELIASKT